eukprot:CAMPEP_0172540152 /NCGR_PEP_ID=MMETSP1067-20121228/11219_1 /TAXON_ID=265564 ORGANISM="Thalassiosira punctigera, Strain Tpunct2005C2" /NCGR_SAMPLE_ID=MMETSP1067 /ASSEMBLY_ACC=CAM_ASM_000444 /LENGTH=290 /DNA_ID=CAMNT_0013325949 /DNA_START=31 /DNA_END=903 /DNA_ORIENTATION=+
MSLPPKSIDEILAMANDRHKLPSPRGVADMPRDSAKAKGNDFLGAPAAVGTNRAAGSAVERPEHAAAPSAAPSAARASSSSSSAPLLGPFPDERTAVSAVVECAARFLHDVLSKALTMTGHCYRTRVRAADVARALELFATIDAGGPWYRSFPSGAADEDEDDGEDDAEAEDESWKDEEATGAVETKAMEDDDTLHYDDDGSESEGYDDEMSYIDETEYDLTNADTPLFDESYPPIEDGEIHQLTNDQFKEHLLLFVLEEREESGVPLSEGVDTMLKCAMYSFLVAKLSQ